MGGGGGKSGKKTEIEENFEIAIFPVTQGQWQALMGKNPSWFSPEGEGWEEVSLVSSRDLDQFPVEMVSWNDMQGFINRLNEREKGTGWFYRLPSEAEWEYACRGGATSDEECSYRFSRHSIVQSATDSLSFTNTRFPAMIGIAQVGESATLYLAISSNFSLLGLKTTSSALLDKAISTEPASTTVPHSPRDLSSVQCTLPVLASWQ